MRLFISIAVAVLFATYAHAANWYVSSVDGTSGGTAATWWNGTQTTYDNVARVLALSASGDNVYVDSAHNFQAGAAITWDVPVSGNNISIFSVNRATGASLAGATEDINSTSAVNFTVASASRTEKFYVYGMVFKGGAGSANASLIQLGSSAAAAGGDYEFVNCTFNVLGTNNSNALTLGTLGGSSRIRMTDCTVNLTNNASAYGTLIKGGDVLIRNLTVGFSGANKPSPLFQLWSTSATSIVSIVDSDLTSYNKTGGAYLSATGNAIPVFFRNCKLSSVPALTAGSFPSNQGYYVLLNCEDSANTKYYYHYANRLGTVDWQTAIYANDGLGATLHGTNGSWKIVTTSSCNEFEPFITQWTKLSTSITSSVTADLELDFDSATELTDRTAWANFDYLSSASFMQGTFVTTRNALPFIGTGVNLTTSTIAWFGTGGFSNEKKRTITATFAPAQAGSIRGRLVIGATSWTGYLDPKVRGIGDGPPVVFDEVGAFNVLATPTATPTPTSTPTSTPTPTATATASFTPCAPTPTATATATPSATFTPTSTPTATFTPTPNTRAYGDSH